MRDVTNAGEAPPGVDKTNNTGEIPVTRTLGLGCGPSTDRIQGQELDQQMHMIDSHYPKK